MELRCEHIDQLPEIAQAILNEVGEIRVILLNGDLGSGKTTLVKALCKCLGVTDVVTSPTFALVNVYQMPGGDECAHIDLYRLESTEELIQAGIEEYVRSGQWCFIEWPELARPVIDQDCAEIFVEITTDSHRKLRILKRPAID